MSVSRVSSRLTCEALNSLLTLSAVQVISPPLKQKLWVLIISWVESQHQAPSLMCLHFSPMHCLSVSTVCFKLHIHLLRVFPQPPSSAHLFAFLTCFSIWEVLCQYWLPIKILLSEGHILLEAFPITTMLSMLPRPFACTEVIASFLSLINSSIQYLFSQKLLYL